MRGTVKTLLLIKAALVAAFLFSCEAEPFEADNGNNNFFNRQLDITVYHVYSTLPYADSLLVDVEVVLYEERQDRLLDLNRKRIARTDSAGTVVFELLEEREYFIAVYDTELGIDTSETIFMPGNALISYLDIRWQPQ
jgi:hypothetical protein